jgi:hypothetical protein
MAEFDEAAAAAARLEAALERIAAGLAGRSFAGAAATGHAPADEELHGEEAPGYREALAAERAAEQARTAEVAARLDELISQLRAALARASSGDAGAAPGTAPGLPSGIPPGQS